MLVKSIFYCRLSSAAGCFILQPSKVKIDCVSFCSSGHPFKFLLFLVYDSIFRAVSKSHSSDYLGNHSPTMIFEELSHFALWIVCRCLDAIPCFSQYRKLICAQQWDGGKTCKSTDSLLSHIQVLVFSHRSMHCANPFSPHCNLKSARCSLAGALLRNRAALGALHHVDVAPAPHRRPPPRSPPLPPPSAPPPSRTGPSRRAVLDGTCAPADQSRVQECKGRRAGRRVLALPARPRPPRRLHAPSRAGPAGTAIAESAILRIVLSPVLVRLRKRGGAGRDRDFN